MLLTADIGNTNIVLALLDEKDRVVSQCRVPSGDPLPPEAYDDAIRRVLEGQAAPEGAAIGSVVPRLTAETADAIRRVAGLEALVVGPTTPAGLDIAIEQPETLGVDLLAADAAAAAEYPLPVVVFDFGTATTVTVVDRQRRYRGGVILAGVKLSLHALFPARPSCRISPWRPRGRSSAPSPRTAFRPGPFTAPPPWPTACWSAWRRSWGSPVLPWPPGACPGSLPPTAAGGSGTTTVCCCGVWP